ncbi:hypothetical protein QBC35DRAFT_542260 [Podospora australis]|uniref:Ankyrin repeat protein n=1 Tax=Podospora australis TaxID=1536484 RepID=A0AAN6WLY5_9PEZI|nr:hypothetical protein QBC35DRAFT_542260 [Podospora australis]
MGKECNQCSDMAKAVVELLLDIGAMSAFEHENGASGLPLLVSCTHTDDGGWPLVRTLREPICRAMRETSYWDMSREDRSTISLLKRAIEMNITELVLELLQRGVSVQARENGYYALELACYSAANFDDRIFLEVVRRADRSDLNQLNPAGQQVGLLHMMATCGAMNFEWRLPILLKQGLDLNLKSGKESISRWYGTLCEDQPALR